MYKKPKIDEHQHKEKDGLKDTSDLSEALFDKRIIILDEAVTERSTSEVLSHILLMNLESTRKPIILLLNTGGGDMYSAFGLIDVIRSSKAKIYTVCIGMAASAGAMILAAGHKRFALPSTQIMIHCHWQAYNEPSVLTHHDLLIEAKQSEYLFKLNSEYYMKVTGQSEEIVKAMLARDTWMSPTEAKALNVIDEIGWDIYSWLK